MSSQSIPLPPDYAERVYAGVLGKLIGVYSGRPFEQWSHEAISARWGEIRSYVNADLGKPLIVTDDDISGTFTFLRALVEHGARPDLSSREIGQTWLNQIAEGRHILWWGGIGLSAEHTAYLRLLDGIEAPRSGSTALNGTGVSEEIGAQIFIDGWALVAPGNPDLAVRLATEAARVSHDGEAVHGARVVAALVSQAFVEYDLNKLIDKAVSYIPPESEIARLIADLRRWRTETDDWREGLRRLVESYGYARYGTNCPMVSNHGVIHLALLWGNGDFDRSLMIVNTAGYDTDCNAGNVGCILGVRNGLAALDAAYDWRTPVNDRLFQPAADGHRGVTDASALALEVADLGRALAGHPAARAPRTPLFSFPFPGSTHGFAAADDSPRSITVRPVPGGVRLVCAAPALWADAEADLFLTPSTFHMENYGLSATPRLYAGQTLRARVVADAANHSAVTVALAIRAHAPAKAYVRQRGPNISLAPGAAAELSWTVPSTGLWPIGAVSLGMQGPVGSAVCLEWLDWSGVPALDLTPPPGVAEWGEHTAWERAWVGNLHQFRAHPGFIDASHNRDHGLIHTGAGDWADYTVEAVVTPWVARRFGIAARVQGLTRHVSLVLQDDGTAALVRQTHDRVTIAAAPFTWELRRPVRLKLRVAGPEITGWIDGVELLHARDETPRLETGGIGLLIDTGRMQVRSLELHPVSAG